MEDLKQFNRRQFEFEMINTKPVSTRQYKLSEEHAKIMEFHLAQWEKKNILEPSYNYKFNSACFLIPKASLHTAPPHDRLNPIHYRAVADLRKLNSNVRKQIIYKRHLK